MSEVPVITVDGPGGTGKGTICAYLAARTGWHLLDSGALYRVLAHAAISRQLPLDDEAGLSSLAMEMKLSFQTENQNIRVILDGEDVSEPIRTEICGDTASRIAAYAGVRQALLDKQRAFKSPPGLVADGRDMGTVIFPEAALKLFLTASPDERAKRRYKQLKQKGISVNLQRLSTDIKSRDARDEGRDISPLRPASGAIIIDSTDLGVDEVCKYVSELVQEAFSGGTLISE